MDPAAFNNPFASLDPYLLAAALALARMIGVMTVLPVFTRLGMTGIVRNGTAIVLAAPVLPIIAADIGASHVTLVLVVGLALKEVAVGLVVGLVLGVPLFAADVAGDVLDVQRGSSAASLFDPLQAVRANITGTLFALVMMALYFGSGGFGLTLRAIYDSYGIWPVARFLPVFSRSAGDLFLQLLDTVVAMGLMLVAPIVVCLLLVDLLFALLSRAAPQLQVFYLSLTAKNLVFSLLLVLYGTFLIGYMQHDLTGLLDTGVRLKAIGPSADQ
jgi:type III secretion protein T